MKITLTRNEVSLFYMIEGKKPKKQKKNPKYILKLLWFPIGTLDWEHQDTSKPAQPGYDS